MKVTFSMRNRLLALILAYLITINNQLTAFSQFLDSFMFYLRRALLKTPPRDHDRDNYQVSAPRTLGVDIGYKVSLRHRRLARQLTRIAVFIYWNSDIRSKREWRKNYLSRRTLSLLSDILRSSNWKQQSMATAYAPDTEHLVAKHIPCNKYRGGIRRQEVLWDPAISSSFEDTVFQRIFAAVLLIQSISCWCCESK